MPGHTAGPVRRPGPDPVTERRAVAAAHDRFLSSGWSPSRLRPLVRESWERSVSSGVDPDGVRPRVDLGSSDLGALREAHPLAPLLPLFRRLLLESAPDSGHIAALGDSGGRLLWVDGDRTLRSRAEGMHFVEGADWREQAAGTNAPGLALALDQKVQIFATEHFGRNVQPWSCSAAPVHDPDTGALLGVLDLTGDDSAASPHALALVQATATAAESELRLLRLRGAAPGPAQLPDDLMGSRAVLHVLARDKAALQVDGRTVELSTRHSELLLLLARHPHGLTGDAFTALLREHDASPVTIRAEMSRLRRLLGDQFLASRPYRLNVPVSTDADEVHRLLARGEHNAAFRAYPGPVLPRSVAPGVTDVRDELTAELRSVLASAAADDALTSWAGRPDGREDPRVLRAALSTLPQRSPRATILRAHLDRLA
ncbi:GAF domain-containing protein [Nocardiopsis sp. HNM0947]|uniref:GAF domain-containing protein n=1 Tax=Nocardiopsis coralli TaxID=2772213 RepID=A0ABR9PDN4_9ACTN|nr:GAF domain-containing protein [Nocardiopsis coralli]MBE3001960.1 GAF domain-containing protein [Nocardiopsis coralli]